MESGVHSSLHENCHHHITFVKFNLKIQYPVPYEREDWHYHKANVVSLGQPFCKYQCKQTSAIITQTSQNIISNYIAHETMICNDKNPSWLDQKIKKLVFHKNRTYSAYSRDRNNTDLFNKFQILQIHLKTTLEESKQKYQFTSI